MKGRALTDEQKEEVVRRLLVAWKTLPSLRFGQMLRHVLADAPDPFGRLTVVEDEVLVELVEALARKFGKKP
jgi:hypothetical protein